MPHAFHAQTRHSHPAGADLLHSSGYVIWAADTGCWHPHARGCRMHMHTVRWPHRYGSRCLVHAQRVPCPGARGGPGGVAVCEHRPRLRQGAAEAAQAEGAGAPPVPRPAAAHAARAQSARGQPAQAQALRCHAPSTVLHWTRLQHALAGLEGPPLVCCEPLAAAARRTATLSAVWRGQAIMKGKWPGHGGPKGATPISQARPQPPPGPTARRPRAWQRPRSCQAGAPSPCTPCTLGMRTRVSSRAQRLPAGDEELCGGRTGRCPDHGRTWWEREGLAAARACRSCPPTTRSWRRARRCRPLPRRRPAARTPRRRRCCAPRRSTWSP